MSLSLWAAFVVATTILMAIPGPNVALIVANSLRFGPRHGMLTVAGTSLAGMLQLCLTLAGLTALIGGIGSWFFAVRWLGAVYLVVLGIRQWRAAPIDLDTQQPEMRSRRKVLVGALAISLTNPKTLLFFGAFLPQFMTADAPAGPQLAVLAVTYLAVAALMDCGWALLAARARRLLLTHSRLPNRLSGGLLIGAGAGLAMARAT